jgi:hypothetical protein
MQDSLSSPVLGRVCRYQRGNQTPYIDGGEGGHRQYNDQTEKDKHESH